MKKIKAIFLLVLIVVGFLLAACQANYIRDVQGGDRCAVINLSTYWYKCSVEYKDKRIFLRSACDRRSLLPVNEKTALQGGFFEGSNTCR
jgi:predicted small secreted protein